jgi:two-component system, response regulator YesN
MYTLLIVDDEPLTGRFLQTHIPQWDPRWEVAAVAGDGVEALELMKERHFDLVISDIKMPEMDGLELCRHLAETNPLQKVMLLSGYNEFSMAQEAIRYGVSNYLLKPIQAKEVILALGKIASELELDNSRQLALRALQSVSKETQKQAVTQFLTAVVTRNHIEIKNLYPLMYRIKVNLIEAEAAVLILNLDEAPFYEKSLPFGERGMFLFILHRVVSELAEELDTGIAFSDHEQHTCLLITGENAQELKRKSSMLFEQAASTLRIHTGLSLTGALGSSISEVLQLDMSYRQARSALQARLLQGCGHLYFHEEMDWRDTGNTSRPARIQRIDRSLTALGNALSSNEDWGLAAATRDFIELIDPLNVSQALLFGHEMILHLARLQAGNPSEVKTENALNTLRKLLVYGNQLTREHVAETFMEAIKTLLCQETDNRDIDDIDLVAKARAYIVAHYAEPLSLAMIAEKVGVSPAYLSTVFSQRQQEGYIKFLTRIRMDRAAKLLAEPGEQKIYDIAEQVGYLSAKHFSHVFKQHFGLPPGEYQEKMRTGSNHLANKPID